MLKTIKTYTFSNIKRGEETIGRTNLINTGARTVNPGYVVSIDKLENPEFTLFHVSIDRTASPLDRGFYTDYEGFSLLTKSE